MTDERKNMLNNCYARSLRKLRDAHDEEFRAILAEEYAKNGLDIAMRASRLSKSQTA